jgi:hypothetical protein
MHAPTTVTFSTVQVCRMFGLVQKMLESAIMDGFVTVPRTRKGSTRRYGFWDAVKLGIFAELLRQGLYRRHAAGIASYFNSMLLEGHDDDGRDIWLLAEAKPSDAVAAREGDQPGFRVNTAWVRRDQEVLCLPKVEPQQEGESKSGRTTYFQRAVTAVNVSAIAREVTRYGPDGDLHWRITASPNDLKLLISERNDAR